MIDNSVSAFVDGKTIINGRLLTDADLLNMSVMASAKSIVNARNIVNAKPIVNGVQLYDTTKVVDLALQSIFNYQLDSSSSPLVNAKNIVNARTIVNAKSIVNGTAEVNAKNIVNGSNLLNSNDVGDTSNQNVVVIIDETDVTAETNVLSDFKSVNMITGVTAGDFRIVPAALLSENFEIRYGLGRLKILPAALSVTANNAVIFQGDPLPKFTSDVKGLKYSDTVISGPSYALNPVYQGSAGTYTITPSNIVLACPECYITTYKTGTLYVDPKGKNVKNLKPYLVCVDTLINDPSGLKYIATYGCSNDNSTLIYVPKGPDNNLSGEGSATAVGNLTEFFQPGGTNTCQIKFNGKKLIWTVRTYYVNQKTAATQDASSTSQRCKKGTNAVIAVNNIPERIVLSPNPTQGKFIISADKGIISDKSVLISDMTGKNYIPGKINKLSSKSLEIELPAGATKGVYFVRVKIDNDYKTFRVVKL